MRCRRYTTTTVRQGPGVHLRVHSQPAAAAIVTNLPPPDDQRLLGSDLWRALRHHLHVERRGRRGKRREPEEREQARGGESSAGRSVLLLEDTAHTRGEWSRVVDNLHESSDTRSPQQHEMLPHVRSFTKLHPLPNSAGYRKCPHSTVQATALRVTLQPQTGVTSAQAPGHDATSKVMRAVPLTPHPPARQAYPAQPAHEYRSKYVGSSVQRPAVGGGGGGATYGGGGGGGGEATHTGVTSLHVTGHDATSKASAVGVLTGG